MGKGKLSGSARKEINQRRAADLVKTSSDDVTFGRVTKLLGFNHIMVAIPTKSDPKEIRVRIPKLFTKKGATPITTREVVAIYVGNEFDPASVKPNDQFDITAILTVKQANDLVLAGVIPRWMVHEDIVSGSVKGESDGKGWEFGYSDLADDDGDGGDDSDKSTTEKVPKGAKNPIVFGSGKGDSDSDSDKNIDIDAI